MRRVESKTFYLIDGVWTDSEFKAESRLPETALVFGSDEYFALLKQHPKLGSYFALGQRVLVVFEGRVYRVNDPPLKQLEEHVRKSNLAKERKEGSCFLLASPSSDGPFLECSNSLRTPCLKASN